MKNKECNVCPGCKRACSAQTVRCKYGKKYFAALEMQGRQRKWEKGVEKGGLAWRFLKVSRKMKKALRKKRMSEEQAFSLLTETERAELQGILEKLEIMEA